ncbi:MAG: hypothetical protein IJF54_01935 [Clostridia bacterium]|nr:hypothetical protein [Clostridia bacterium]
MFRPIDRQPDFKNLEAVLQCKTPSRPTLFEFFLNDRLYNKLTDNAPYRGNRRTIEAFDSAGYDYSTVRVSDFKFAPDKHKKQQTISLNDGVYITDRESFDAFPWRDPNDFPMDDFLAIPDYLPQGMKVIPWSDGGVLENVISLTGYENLCIMLYEDRQLVYDIFEKVGSSLLKYYESAVNYDFVGAIISNDDWGFNTQTMLSPKDMREFVFPWHKKIVELAHNAGKYAILHSCGRYDEVIDDVINDMKFDARHSYEDNITPVEKAYDDLQGKIAVLGGLDMNFVATKTPDEVYARAKAMVEKGKTGYALGTGNSVPEYVPDENYFAMIKAVF